MSKAADFLCHSHWRLRSQGICSALCTFCVLVAAPQYSFAMSYKAQEQYKEAFKKGFLMTCEPTIKSQFERAGLSAFFSFEERVAYCTCVAIKIFDDLNTEEIEFVNAEGELPPRKKQEREGYSSECFDSEISL